MKPYKHVLLVCDDEYRERELEMVLGTRLAATRIRSAHGEAIRNAVREFKPRCAVLTHGDIELIDFLRGKEIPTLEIGQAPSYADRVVSGKYMMDVLEAIRIMCARKRGPKKAVAA